MDRKAIIHMLLNTYSHRRYLEIGISKGKNFTSIEAEHKIGIDPSPPPELVEQSLNDECKYFDMTSDDYFNTVANTDDFFDVIFIDGLHVYEQVYRDIVNSLNHLSTDGYIVVHDCKPTTELMGSPSRTDPKGSQRAWTGDVWKAIVRLRSFHSDLLVFTLDCDYGCAIVAKRTPQSLLQYSLEEIEAMSFKDLESNYDSYLNLKQPSYFDEFLATFRKE